MVCHLTNIDERVLSVYVDEVFITRMGTTTVYGTYGTSLMRKEKLPLIRASVLEEMSLVCAVVFLYHVNAISVRCKWQNLCLFGKARSWIERLDIKGRCYFLPYHIGRLRILDTLLM